MKTNLALLAAATALGALIAIPAVGAVRSIGSDDWLPAIAANADPVAGGTIVLASDDEDDHEESARDRDDDDEDDHEGESRAGANPAPDGAVTPPANGLFGNGTTPQVQVK